MGAIVTNWTWSDVVDIACEVNYFSQASSSRWRLALLGILLGKFARVLALVLPRLELARFSVRSCGPLITNKKLVNILHVHCHSYRADAWHSCILNLVLDLELALVLLIVLLPAHRRSIVLALALLLATRPKLPNDLPPTPWTLMSLGHLLLHHSLHIVLLASAWYLVGWQTCPLSIVRAYVLLRCGTSCAAICVILDLVAYLGHWVFDGVALLIGLSSLHLMWVGSLVVVSSAWVSRCHLMVRAPFGVLFQISCHRRSLCLLFGLLLLEVDAVVV